MVSKKQHWDAVGQLRCVVSNRPNPTIHHCHSGSMKELGGMLRGGGQKVSDFLVIPLHADFHTGSRGIDTGLGVKAWEECFGRQLDHLATVCRLVGYDVFQLAGLENVECSSSTEWKVKVSS